MTTEQLVEKYTPVGDMITIIISIILLFVIAKVLYNSRDRKFIFLKRSLHFVLLGAGSNIAFYLLISNNVVIPVILYILRDLYHFSFFCCLYCYVLYIKRMLDISGSYAKIAGYIFRFVFCIFIIFDFISPITKWGFHQKNGLWYDSVVSPYNVFYALTLVLLLLMLLIYAKRFIRSLRTCLIVTEAIIVCIMIYQAYLNTNTFSGFTYLLPILVVLILLHSKPFDDKTGALGISSFESFIENTRKNGISIDYMVLKLSISVINQLPDELGKVLNSFWHSYFKDAFLYSLSSDLYILAIPRNEKNGDTERKMDELINYHFQGYYDEYRLPYRMVKLYKADFIENVDDIRGVLQYLFKNMEDNSTFIVDEETRQRLQKYKVIRDNLADIDEKGDLDDERVIVYCQPIRNIKTQKFDTGEALMRMSLPEVGFLYPDMFIELAEEYNHIHALSKIMLNKVCKHIKQFENENYKFERISVNFAASEIKADGFCDEILKIIRDNGVDPSRIGIELTETQTESDFLIVKKKIAILRAAGMTLYLDDVGTGYSNLDRIVQYDVDVVKFDRFFLLEAENSRKITKMVSHLSQAFRDLDYKLLYEGVELDSHEDLCLNCGADYIQGYMYSKPVPIEEMRNFFEK